ncbi:MAG: amidohydrolase [Pseudomonadales bacterium]|jgi:amidohydrolase|nr:amidohydrolase [Pseudomonadales bacterium]
MRVLWAVFLLAGSQGLLAAERNPALEVRADELALRVAPKVVAWRRDIHAHPELSNREFRTAALVAAHLRELGLEVTTGVGHTGVVGILRGGKAGPMVALRADMDALPVVEQVDLPFASTVKSTYLGAEVGVMHACGHDTHVAMLMGAAEVLAGMREQLPGAIKFIFQPAEEGPPEGEEGGADMMIKAGVLADVDAIFGLHVFPSALGSIAYRSGGTMASSDSFRIKVKGRQTHGAVPWGGVDPIVVAAQIVLGLQTIPSRQLDSTLTPSIITVGKIQGGVRSNIIPDEVEMLGTIRTFDNHVRQDIQVRMARTASLIAESAGATAAMEITSAIPVTVNHPALTALMVPTLERLVGKDQLSVAPRMTTAEDFSYYQLQVPGLFIFLGVADPADPTPAANHSPFFFADERALPVGVQALTHLALDYLQMNMARMPN